MSKIKIGDVVFYKEYGHLCSVEGVPKEYVLLGPLNEYDDSEFCPKIENIRLAEDKDYIRFISYWLLQHKTLEFFEKQHEDNRKKYEEFRGF